MFLWKPFGPHGWNGVEIMKIFLCMKTFQFFLCANNVEIKNVLLYSVKMCDVGSG